MSETNEIVPVVDTTQSDVLAGAWSVERHLSPLALFDPNRSAICAQYQLALIDDNDNEARAHVAAARRHLQAAVTAESVASGRFGNLGDSLRKICARLDELSRSWD